MTVAFPYRSTIISDLPFRHLIVIGQIEYIFFTTNCEREEKLWTCSWSSSPFKQRSVNESHRVWYGSWSKESLAPVRGDEHWLHHLICFGLLVRNGSSFCLHSPSPSLFSSSLLSTQFVHLYVEKARARNSMIVVCYCPSILNVVSSSHVHAREERSRSLFSIRSSFSFYWFALGIVRRQKSFSFHWLKGEQ